MNKFRILLIIACIALLNTSCEDDKEKVVLKSGDGTPSSIVTPNNDAAFELLIAEADSNFERFTWTAADYGAVLPRSYTLEMDVLDGSFSASEELVITSDLNFEMTNGALNLIMFDMGLESNASNEINFRIKSTVANDAVDTLLSESNSVFITMYEYGKPNFIAPEDGGSYVLEKDTVDVEFANFTWVAAEYGTSYDITYILEMDEVGDDFADPVELEKTEELSYAMTVAEMNGLLLELEYVPGESVDFEFRVTSRISSKSGVVYSDLIKLNITPYSDDVVGGDPNIIYLLGSATSAGEENGDNVLPAYYLESSGDDSTFAVCDELIPGGSLFFIKVIGEWIPQWGSDGSGTWEAGGLVKKSADSDPDALTIPVPDVQGDYLIKTNVVSMTYTMEAIGTTLHIVGDGTEAGWTPENAIPMNRIAAGKFSLVANLNATGGIKLLVNQGAWAPQYGRDENGTWSEGNLMFRPTEDVTDPEFIPAPEEAGSYLIEVDLARNSYKVTPQ